MGKCQCKVKVAEPTELLPIEGPFGFVTVVGARGLRGPGWIPDPDKNIFCTIADSNGHQLHRTKFSKDGPAPFWREEILLENFQDNSLLFRLWEATANTSPELLGEAELDASSFIKMGFDGELPLEHSGECAPGVVRVKVKLTGQDYPPGFGVFKLDLQKVEKEPVGLDWDVQDGAWLLITAVHPGLFERWNHGAHISQQLVPGDFIVKVNGVEGHARKLSERLKKDRSLEVAVRRSQQICAVVACAPHGLEVKWPANGNSLLIRNVKEGAVQEWNKNNPDHAVRAGDRIVAVNGWSGKCEQLHRAMKADAFTLTLSRPADLDDVEMGFDGLGSKYSKSMTMLSHGTSASSVGSTGTRSRGT